MPYDDHVHCRTSKEIIEEQAIAIANATEPLRNPKGMCSMNFVLYNLYSVNSHAMQHHTKLIMRCSMYYTRYILYTIPAIRYRAICSIRPL
jgi:hypothetical protein